MMLLWGFDVVGFLEKGKMVLEFLSVRDHEVREDLHLCRWELYLEREAK